MKTKGAEKFRPHQNSLTPTIIKITKLFNDGKLKKLSTPEAYVLSKILKDYAFYATTIDNQYLDKLKIKADKYDALIKLLK
jgi:hypothetical protein